MRYMTCLGTGSIEEVMSRQSPEEGTAFTPRQGGSAKMRGVCRGVSAV